MTNVLSTLGLVSVYSIVVGFSMIGLWTFLFATNQVFIPTNPQKPMEIAYHVSAEVLRAALLICSGIGILLGIGWARAVSMITLGMLPVYCDNSPGFYANQGNLPMVVMFSILAILTIASIIVIFRFSH
jgi:hypothetical protein